MRTAKAAVRMLFAVAAVALITGCGDGTGPNNGVAGDYSLILVNGAAPPAVVVDAIVRDTVNDTDERLLVEIVDGNLDLDGVGTYGWTVRFDVTVDDQLQFDDQPISVSGRYEVDGDIIRLTPTVDSLPPTDATLDGRAITFSDSLPEYGDVLGGPNANAPEFTLTFQKKAADNDDIY